MTTLTTVLGTNSAAVAYAQSSTASDLITGVENAITTRGWELFDASAGANARCYRAKNADDTTYKYVVLDFGTANTLVVKVYESWDAALHTGTNVCGLATDSYFTQSVDVSDKGIIYVYASRYWLAFIVKAYSSSVLGNGTHTGVTGCFEIARDNPEDTVAAGYPPYCFLNTGVLGDGSATNKPSIILPRTHAGASGTNQYGDVSTVFGKTGMTFKTTDFCPNTVNLWNGQDWAISLYAHGPSNEVKGRIYGLKLFTKGNLFFMDKLKVTCDASYHYDASGTLTDHFVVPGGSVPNAVYNSRFLIPA